MKKTTLENTENSSILENELRTLAEQQGVQPITDIRRLRGDFWPQSERIEDFLDTLRSWRDDEEGTEA